MCLTARGLELARRWKSIERSIEKRWQESNSVHLRASLEQIVVSFPLEHPHYPASYGRADASITGANGQDWKPVFRKYAERIRTVEAAWLDRFGSDSVTELRRALEEAIVNRT